MTVICVTASFSAAGAASGDDVTPTVVVIGTTPLGDSDEAARIAAPVQSASGERIDRSHAADITEFMSRSFGSVHVNELQNNVLQPDVNFRGFTASPLLGTAQGLSVYMDGVRLNQPFGEVVSWDLVPRAAIASIALLPGSNPVFGLNTLGGALSIRTKDGFGASPLSGSAVLGSHHWRSLELESGGHNASGFHWYTTGAQLSDDGWRDASPTNATQWFGKVGWRSIVTDLSLTTAYADTNLTGNGLQEQRFLSRAYRSVYTLPDTTQNRAMLVNLLLRHSINERLSLSSNAYYRNIRTESLNGDLNDDSLTENVYQPNAAERAALTAAGYSGFPLSGENATNTPFPYWRCIANVLLNTEPNERCNGLANRSRSTQHEFGAAAQFIWSDSVWNWPNRLTAGGAFAQSGSRFRQATQFGFLTAERAVTPVEGPGAFADGTQASENAFDARVELSGSTRTVSAYFVDTIGLAKSIDVTISARFNRIAVDNRDGIAPEGGPGSLAGEHRFSRLNPALGLTWATTKESSTYFGYSEGSRAPSAIELGCSDPANPCRLPNALAGDPPLRQVVTKTLEVGVRGTRADLGWNAGLFTANNYDDILFVADNAAGFGYFKNFGATRRRGVEFGVNTRAARVEYGAHYTFLDATYRSDEIVNGDGNSANDGPAQGFPGSIQIRSGDRIPLTPRHLFKANVDWDFLPNVSVSFDALVSAGSLARGNENNRHQSDGVYYLGPGRTGGYTIVNMGLEWAPTAAAKIFAQINNLFDREYVTAAQLGATGFTASGAFIARPFATPVIDGGRPLVHATFYAPGAPRELRIGTRFAFR